MQSKVGRAITVRCCPNLRVALILGIQNFYSLLTSTPPSIVHVNIKGSLPTILGYSVSSLVIISLAYLSLTKQIAEPRDQSRDTLLTRLLDVGSAKLADEPYPSGVHKSRHRPDELPLAGTRVDKGSHEIEQRQGLHCLRREWRFLWVDTGSVYHDLLDAHLLIEERSRFSSRESANSGNSQFTRFLD